MAKKNWSNKAHQKIFAAKVAKQALESKEYKEMLREQMVQATLNALAKFSFCACEYLEMNFGCKKKGMQKFLEFMKHRIGEMENDHSFFEACESYFMETYQLDVLRELGMQLDKEED